MGSGHARPGRHRHRRRGAVHLRQAADLDYGLIVLADACLDADPEVRRVLTEKVFPRQAEVSTVAQWSEQLASP
jgi:nicotinamidase-related amidase